MTGFLLDTNVISELRKPRPHGGVVTWFESLPTGGIFLSAFALGELQRGVERTRKSDPDKARLIDAWVDELAASQNILPMDGPAFREWARIVQGKSD
ncbi:MAG TPA: PIN domain-containing protein, partial [Candidatus Acidoferrum sp.]|nr:PIN domain-containing protein [Candidatus Acidoferrum sp.]